MRFAPFTTVLFALALLTGWLVPAAAATSDFGQAQYLAVRTAKTRAADVYLLRGIANVFSRGLDEMGDRLRRRGVDAQVLNHTRWRDALQVIVKNRKTLGRRPVVLVGHSLGANAILRLARELEKQRIRVDYMATFAATNPIPVTSNVRRVTNYYFKTRGWGRRIQPGPGFKGVLKNIDFSNDDDVGHFNIEQEPRLQKQVVDTILRTIRRRRADR